MSIEYIVRTNMQYLIVLLVLFLPADSFGKVQAEINQNHFSNASKIKIKFLGYSELSGEYLVDDSSIITIPVLGRFSIKNLTGSELESLLAENTSKITKKEAYVSVEILEYKPFFVTGYIMQPGSKEWRPGTTIFHAISISGGYYRNDRSTEAALVLRAVESETNILKRSISDLKLSYAEVARLEAELENRELTVPDRLIDLVGQLEANTLIEYQRTILKRDKDAFESQIALFRRGILEANVRIEALQKQKTLAARQLELKKRTLKGIESLWKNKTINSNRLFTEQISVMTIEANIAQIDVTLSGARNNKLNLQQEIGRFKLSREQSIASRIGILQRQIAQLRIEIDAAQVAYRRLTGQSSVNSSPNQSRKIVFNIVRKDANSIKTITADENSLLMPGDILVVKSVSNSSDNTIVNSQTRRLLDLVR